MLFFNLIYSSSHMKWKNKPDDQPEGHHIPDKPDYSEHLKHLV